MDHNLYQRYLNEYVQAALDEGGGSVQGAREYLSQQEVRGLFVTHRKERQRALADARQAFDEHKHWPLELILKQLGVAGRD
jgi:hypothetical protein